ncbi:metallophosphoesterase [Bacillus sp. AFS076308]|uniref:metallophosphoesterase n=1 Tax=unclassified Bacillus (in: firmicutes) TaxID=185979 RepID=UPI000BF8680B|nr:MULTISPECIES: metallophosphoesterase [unclassified Bacillus (in: firmicutes)]PFN78802.1 metallophosphoesterase [Bacillus sp. AFS076308]PGV49033.1 metallophosphoesterase [Bacillus sp. AFS037270]
MIWGTIVLLFVGGILLLLFMVREAFLNKVVEQELTFPDFPASFGKVSIFFISDIHRRVISDVIIQNVKGKADFVIIGGDLTEKGVPFPQVKENLVKLKQIGPVYFVWGNNDYEVDFRKLDATLLDIGVKVLDNTAVTFESNRGEKLSLLGVDDCSQERDRLDFALMDAEESSFKILASHIPTITEKIRPEHNIRLVLSGHTHGGQIHILGYSPFEKGKIKKLENTILLISNGYGTTTLPLRLGAPAETHLITLKRGTDKIG